MRLHHNWASQKDSEVDGTETALGKYLQGSARKSESGIGRVGGVNLVI